MIENQIPKPKKCILFGISFLKYKDGTYFLKFESPMKSDNYLIVDYK
jgi:hypothetical protein